MTSTGSTHCAAGRTSKRLLLLLAAAAVSAGAGATNPDAPIVGAWSQLGKTQHRENVQAISIDYGPDGFPVFAYGWDDPAVSNGTRIPVNAWNGKEWVEVHHRTSQFPQNYREFSLKAADNTYYLGLKVNSGMGSVLNGGVEWRGSWAFSNQHYDYEIEPHGDMYLFLVNTNPVSQCLGTGGKPGVIKYAAKGWTQYPAGNAFDCDSKVVLQGGPEGAAISDLRLVRAAPPRATDGRARVAAADVATYTYAMAWIAEKDLLIKISSLEGYRVLLRGVSTVNLASTGPDTCVVYQQASAADGNLTSAGQPASVSCTSDGSYDKWDALGVAIEAAAVVPRFAVELAITADRRVIVAARSGDDRATVVVRWRQLGDPASVWHSADLDLAAPVTHFELSSSGNAVHAAVSERNGEGLKVFQLVL